MTQLNNNTDKSDSSILFDLVSQSLHFFFFKAKLGQQKTVEKEANKIANSLADKMVIWVRNQIETFGVPESVMDKASWNMKVDKERNRLYQDHFEKHMKVPKTTEVKIGG